MWVVNLMLPNLFGLSEGGSQMCAKLHRVQWSGSAEEAFWACRYSAGFYLLSDSTSPSTSATASSSASLEVKLLLSFAYSSCLLPCLYSWPQVFPPACSRLTFMPLNATVLAPCSALCPVLIHSHPLVSCAAFASCFFLLQSMRF